jgi:hypothetical protein
VVTQNAYIDSAYFTFEAQTAASGALRNRDSIHMYARQPTGGPNRALSKTGPGHVSPSLPRYTLASQAALPRPTGTCRWCMSPRLA